MKYSRLALLSTCRDRSSRDNTTHERRTLVTYNALLFTYFVVIRAASLERQGNGGRRSEYIFLERHRVVLCIALLMLTTRTLLH